MLFDVKFNIDNKKIPLVFEQFQSIAVTVDVEGYEAEYEATPQRIEQVFQTANKLMLNNFVVKPIPKEYGLVTYDQDRTITIT